MAQVVVELSGDEAKLFRSYQRIIEQSQKLNTTVKSNKKAHDDAFGPASLGALGTYAGKFVSVAAAVSAVSSALTTVMAKQKELAQQQRTDVIGIGPLAQLALGDKKKFQDLYKQAQQAYQVGGAATLGEAGQLLFQIHSANLQKYHKEIVALRASGAVPDAMPLVVGGQAFTKGMGEQAVGGFPGAVSMGLGVSQFAPAQVQEILQQAGRTGGQARALGLKPQEVLAAITAASIVAGGAEEGGTQVQNLLKNIELRAMRTGVVKKGQSLSEMLDAMQAQVDKGRSASSILGPNIRAIAGFRNLVQTKDVYEQALAAADTAKRQNLFETTGQIYKAVPEMAAARLATEATARGTLAATRGGIYSNLADAVQEDLVNRVRSGARGIPIYNRIGPTLESGRLTTERWAMGNENFVNMYLEYARQETQERVRAARQIEDSLNRAAANLEAGTESTRQRAAAAVQPE